MTTKLERKTHRATLGRKSVFVPVGQNLVLYFRWERILEISSLPVLSGSILDGQQRVRDDLAAPVERAVAVRHVRDEREAGHVFEEDLVGAGAAAGAEGPDDVLEVVDVNVLADEHQAVDRVADLVSEHDVADLLAEVLGAHLGGA